MEAKVEIDAKRALSLGQVNRAMTDYFEARLADVKIQLVLANESTFKQIQGRALELQDLLKLTKLTRE